MTGRSNETLRWLTHVLDDLIPIPGTRRRIGIDPLLGLLPGGGDVAGAVMSAYTLLVGYRAGAPPSVLVRITANILIDAVVGAIPLLGDLFDAGWKANRRNLALIERFLQQPGPVQRSSRALVAALLTGIVLLLIATAALGILAVRWLVSLF